MSEIIRFKVPQSRVEGEPRASVIVNAWEEAQSVVLPVLAVKYGARWAPSASMRQVLPTEEAPPALTPYDDVLFTRELGRVWGSYKGLRLMVAQDIKWEVYL